MRLPYPYISWIVLPSRLHLAVCSLIVPRMPIRGRTRHESRRYPARACIDSQSPKRGPSNGLIGSGRVVLIWRAARRRELQAHRAALWHLVAASATPRSDGSSTWRARSALGLRYSPVQRQNSASSGRQSSGGLKRSASGASGQLASSTSRIAEPPDLARS